MIVIPTRNLSDLRVPLPAERLAAWAYRYHLTRDSENARIDMARTRRLKVALTRNLRRVQG